MTINRDTLVRLAAAAGLGQHLPPEPGLPGTWYGTDLDALERFASGLAVHLHARIAPTMVLKTRDIDPAILRDLFAKAQPGPLQLMPPDESEAAVLAEREACAQACAALEVHDVGHAGTAFKVQDMCMAAIRARGAA